MTRVAKAVAGAVLMAGAAGAGFGSYMLNGSQFVRIAAILLCAVAFLAGWALFDDATNISEWWKARKGGSH